MKKLICCMLSSLLLFSSSAPDFTGNRNDVLKTINEGYGIPIDVLKGLDSEVINSLYQDVSENSLVSAKEGYIKFTETETGDMFMHKATRDQYLFEAVRLANSSDESSGWMRFYTTVYEVDSMTGAASCAFTWLTPPTPRMTDAVGVSVKNGTYKAGTANGFYSHISPNINYDYTFTAGDIYETGAGATGKFRLKLSDCVYDTHDFVFFRLNFTKEGDYEGVHGTYVHQIFMYIYEQDTGYMNIVW